MNKREIKEIVEMYNYIISNNLSEKIKTIAIDYYAGNGGRNDPYYDLIKNELDLSGCRKYFGISGGIRGLTIGGNYCDNPYLIDLELLRLFKDGNFKKLKEILDNMIVSP